MKLANKKLVTVGLLLAGAHTLAFAAEDRITIHGYGDTAFVRATENNYTGKYSGNSWDYNYLSLNVSAQLDDKTKVVAQMRQGNDIATDMGAYINYNATDNLTARAGQMKVPVGIFNELRDIKFLQQSVLSPLMYQDAAGTLPDSFRGVEGIYHLDMGKHRMTFDLYGGEPRGSNTYIQINPGNWFLVQNIYGIRLTYKTPLGLKFSASTFQNDLLTNTGSSKPASNTMSGQSVRRLSSGSIDYRGSNLDIKMEYAIASQFEGTTLEQRGTSYYGQMGYTFADKYTPYVRYDYISYNNAQPDEPMYYQKVKVLGLSYRLNNNVSLRMENHWNTGYAIPTYAQGGPISNGGKFDPNTAKLDWNIFAMGINFVF